LIAPPKRRRVLPKSASTINNAACTFIGRSGRAASGSSLLGQGPRPWLFGRLIDTGSRYSVFGGYVLGTVLMVLAAGVAWRWGVAAERKPLEAVSRPLAQAD
jgi:hypothetical protein